MIGLSRLKRAIEDVPTGGMQTGDPKVRLKLCDAQRIEVEFNAIIAERDNVLAQNAELVAQVESVRQACLDWENTETPNAWQLIFDEIKRCANTEPPQSLRDHDAKVGRAGYVEGYDSCWFQHYATRAPEHATAYSADQYAEKVRSGEV